MTAPAFAPAEAPTEHDDDVHIRCMVCKHDPVTSVCGVVMTESDERKDQASMNCERCAELWPIHVANLHPVSRGRMSRRCQ